MFNSSFKIATVWGIPIKVHISLLLMVLWLSLDVGLFYGTLLTVGLLTSIALHELGHSIVGIKKGCRVRQITLMCIGGAAQMERMPTRPVDELLMALAGPAVSLVLGITCIFGGNRLPLPPVLPYSLNIIQLLGIINVGLLIFNLMPSFPMDGGRVFRALLTPKLGRLRATLIAATMGKIMAVLFGIYAFFHSQWFLVAIAFFIYTAAGNEYRMVQFQEAARRQGFGFWPPFQERRHGYGNNDKVIISPPPFEDGPDSETTIYSVDDDDSRYFQF